MHVGTQQHSRGRNNHSYQFQRHTYSWWVVKICSVPPLRAASALGPLPWIPCETGYDAEEWNREQTEGGQSSFRQKGLKYFSYFKRSSTEKVALQELFLNEEKTLWWWPGNFQRFLFFSCWRGKCCAILIYLWWGLRGGGMARGRVNTKERGAGATRPRKENKES